METPEIALRSRTSQHKAIGFDCLTRSLRAIQKPPSVLTFAWTFGGFCEDDGRDENRKTTADDDIFFAKSHAKNIY